MNSNGRRKHFWAAEPVGGQSTGRAITGWDSRFKVRTMDQCLGYPAIFAVEVMAIRCMDLCLRVVSVPATITLLAFCILTG